MKKLSIAFLIEHSSTIDSLLSLIRACLIDPRIKTNVYVYASRDKRLKDEVSAYQACQKLIEFLAQRGLYAVSTIVDEEEREIDYANEDIDIIFPQTPYEFYTGRQLEKFINSGKVRVCYAPYGFMLSTQRIYHYHLPFHDRCWRIFVGSPLIRDECIRERGQDFAARVVTAGMPRIDMIRDAAEAPPPANYWNFPVTTAHKRVIWSPHHSFLWPNPDGGLMRGYAMFHVYALTMAIIARDNPQLDIVVRPHPLMWGSIVAQKFMGEEELAQCKKDLFSLPNVRLDEGPSYLDAFWSSDALITDGISFLGEYLYLNKPVFYLRNPEGPGLNAWGEQITKGYYTVEDPKNLPDLVKQVVCNGIDPLQTARQEAQAALFMPPEGAGKFIVDYILKEWEHES